MEEAVLSNGNTFVCLECKNENSMDNPAVGNVVECEFCGIEYEVNSKEGDNYKLIIIEEEK